MLLFEFINLNPCLFVPS